MKQLVKILKWTFISICGLLICLAAALIVYWKIFYVREMNQIKSELNKLENVEVVNIWGHQDITLEEISARLRIKEKGEIVLGGLSSDVFNYPYSVSISEIGGYSFIWFDCNGGIGSGINIGTQWGLGYSFIEKEFHTVKDVLDSYDLILETIENLKMSPEINHFETETSESYLLVKNEKSLDQDPIFNLVGIESLFDFARTLQWNREDSYYNKHK